MSPTPPRCPDRRWRLGAAAGLAVFCGAAQAFVISIVPGPRALFLQVGQGAAGTSVPVVNRVSVTVPANLLGSSLPRAMTSDSTVSRSSLDGRIVCTPPGQVYVAASFRSPGLGGTAALSVSTPDPLVSASGDTLPFSQIVWLSIPPSNVSGEIPSGAFTAGTQLLTNVRSNTWVENCLAFSYSNRLFVAAGVYDGRATFTLVAP